MSFARLRGLTKRALVFIASRDFPRAAEILLAAAFPGRAPSQNSAGYTSAFLFTEIKRVGRSLSDFLLRKYRMPQIYTGVERTCLKSSTFEDPR